MVSEIVTVKNAQGLHMRPAGQLATEMGRFPCSVTLMVGDRAVDAKSLMNIIATGIKCGTALEVVCDGAKEREALARAVELFKTGFGE